MVSLRDRYQHVGLLILFMKVHTSLDVIRKLGISEN